MATEPVGEPRIIEIRHILCPIDFSDASRHALEHAVAVAKWYESRLTALHVIHRPFLPQPPILFAEFPQSTGSTGMERQELEQQLRLWMRPATRAGVKTDVVVDDGNVPGRILEHARSQGSSLIVMGTHGLSGFERFMLGSVTERILRKATCPVMTVPPAAVTGAKVPYTKLLCPVDFSESSLAALRLAFSLAKESDASLTLLHVFDWPPDEELLVARFDAGEFRRVIDAGARERLETLVPEDARVWCKPVTRVGYGKPYRQILEVADAERTDLIVIGVRGRSPVDLVLLGSTTNHVVRSALCPVLTLKQ